MNPTFSIWRAVVVGVFLAALPLAADDTSGRGTPKEYLVYFGTYTKAASKGIYRARLEVATGRLSAAELAIEARDPSFLAVHPNGRQLYAIDERGNPAKSPDRCVSAYAIEPGSGKLELLNQQSAGGAGPCHLSVDATGQSVLVANYSGGSVAAIELRPDGRLGEIGALVQHTGSSVHPTRQKAPHAHAVTLSPDNRFVFTADLGIDRVLGYPLAPAQAKLDQARATSTALPPGSGPRHLAFHPNGRFVYVINELLCTMAVFRYDAARGTLDAVQTISTLPAGDAVKRGDSTAEVAVHPSGRFVYGSNRGHDSIVVFAADPATGRLSLVQHEKTQGRTPRHFAVDPTGMWLLAENQGSDTVVVFRIDGQSGRLTPTGQTIDVPMPVCAVFVPAR